MVSLKRVNHLAASILFVSALSAAGYCQTQEIPMQLTLNTDKRVFSVDEKIGFMLTVKNLSSHDMPIFDNPPSGIRLIFVLLLDGKEYAQTGPMGWGGPNAILPHNETKIAIDLIAYGVTKDMLALGRHSAAVKFNEAVSNTISFEVTGKSGEIHKT